MYESHNLFTHTYLDLTIHSKNRLKRLLLISLHDPVKFVQVFNIRRAHSRASGYYPHRTRWLIRPVEPIGQV